MISNNIDNKRELVKAIDEQLGNKHNNKVFDCFLDFGEWNFIGNEEKARRQRILAINLEFQNYCFLELQKEIKKGNRELQDFLKERNLNDKIIKEWGIGYCPYRVDNFIRGLLKRYSEEEILSTQNFFKSKKGKLYSPFYDRVVFPLWEYAKNFKSWITVGFNGRTFRKQKSGEKKIAKYKNSLNNRVFQKNNYLFGLHRIRNSKGKNLLIVEGNMDVVTLDYNNFNAVATQGTALSDSQCLKLKRLTQEGYFLTLALDNDQAGLNATMKNAKKLFNLDIPFRIFNFIKSDYAFVKDMDEFLNNFSREEFVKQLNSKRMDFEKFTTFYLMKKYSLDFEKFGEELINSQLAMLRKSTNN